MGKIIFLPASPWPALPVFWPASHSVEKVFFVGLYPHEIGLGILIGPLRRWMSDEIPPPAGIFALLIQIFPMPLGQAMKTLRRSKILVAQATFPTEAPEERNVTGPQQALAMPRGLGSSEALRAQGAGMVIADFRIGSA
jgi:hypothetical protein